MRTFIRLLPKAIVLFACSSAFSNFLIAEVPNAAIEAWRKDRVSILEMNTNTLSSDSFTATMEITNTHNDKVISEKVFIAKRNESILISSSKNGIETRLICHDAKTYEIRRKVGTTDWILSKTGTYKQPVDPVAEPDDDEFLAQLMPSNQRLLRLWSMGNASWNEWIKLWDKLPVEEKSNSLGLTLELPHKTMRLEFDSSKDYSLKSITEKFKNSGGDCLTMFQNISKDFTTFNSIEEATWIDKAGISGHRSEKMILAVDTVPPASEIFELDFYNLRFRQPLPESNPLWYLWGPILLGTSLIAFALYLKRRA